MIMPGKIVKVRFLPTGRRLSRPARSRHPDTGSTKSLVLVYRGRARPAGHHHTADPGSAGCAMSEAGQRSEPEQEKWKWSEPSVSPRLGYERRTLLTENPSDAYLDLRKRILYEMRHQGIEESIRELLQESYETALNNLDASPLLSPLSRAERTRLRQLLHNDILDGMLVQY